MKNNITVPSLTDTVKSHRILWSDLKDAITEKRKYMEKKDVIKTSDSSSTCGSILHGSGVLFDCFCCEYAMSRFLSENDENIEGQSPSTENEWCRYCPLQFVSEKLTTYFLDNTNKKPCMEKPSPFERYDDMEYMDEYEDLDDDIIDELKEICDQMISLPLREGFITETGYPLKKIRIVTDAMSRNFLIILTDAPDAVMKEWCKTMAENLEGTGNYSDFKLIAEKGYYIEILFDTELLHPESADKISYDVNYDINDYIPKQKGDTQP